MGVRIMTDSTADIRPSLAGKISAVPLTISFGEAEYTDGVNMSRREFYEHLQTCKDLPKTSQPTPDSFARAYEEAVQAGDQVIVVTISSKLSGTFQSANIGAMDYEGDVFVVDSRNAAIGAGVLAEYAQQLADSGMTAEAIVAKLEEKKEKLTLFAALDTLEYLVRGGRLSKVAGMAGGLLNIKPVITLNGGVIEVIGKARGNKQANTMMSKAVEAGGGIDTELPVMFGYTGLSDDLLRKYMEERGEDVTNDNNTIISGAIGTHVGPGAYAIAYFKK